MLEYRVILERKLHDHAQIGLLIDMESLTNMSRQALLDGMKVLSHLDQVSRCALVSDEEWLQAAASFAQHLPRTLEVKVFAPA